MRHVSCDRCGKEIRRQNDLVTTTFIVPFIVKKYHNACYAQREKSVAGFFLVGAKPLNSTISTIKTIVGVVAAFLVAVVFLISEAMGIFNVVKLVVAFVIIVFALDLIYVRLKSYYTYEKALPN